MQKDLVSGSKWGLCKKLVRKQCFQAAVRKVVLICSVTRTLASSAAQSLGFSYWADRGSHSHLSSTEKRSGEAVSQDSTPTFDSSCFKSQHEFRFPARAMAVALCPPQCRSEAELMFLRSTLRVIPSFRRYSQHMQLMLARVVRYERFGRRRVVVRKGHRGSSFYFVFSGQIAVTQDQDGSSAFIDPEPIFMMKGASFGEVALLKDLRRNATIVCMEETELLVVDREDFFNHQLDQELHREFQRRYSFFRSLDLFCSWSDEDLATLADHCKAEEFNHGQVILRDSSETKNIVFITKGTSVLESQASGDRILGERLCSPRFICSSSDCDRETAAALGPGLGSVRGMSQLEELALRRGLSKASLCCPEGELPSDMVAAVYLRIDALRSRQHFRAVDIQYVESCLGKDGRLPPQQVQNVWGKPSPCRDPRAMVLVSQGCEVIRVKLDKFSEMVDCETLEKLKRGSHSYPSDDELGLVFLEQNRWRVFKGELLSRVQGGGCLDSPCKGRRGGERNSEWDINRLGLLHLTQSAQPHDKIWAAPSSPVATVMKQERQGEETAPPGKEALRLIHSIAIPKPWGSRIY
ncbi:Cyclic nucleotide-binding domain-containing protein 2 [Acipenser ruthenus]|uniref:Cyclic nucleotide-binding domain-containing protein 2 n=1 Tax=Acipenser ruthenus TaxID=7906 RepID=A0A662YVD0_ACIRT|nr:Cyclic nucleotide-binding domain-containing protein 2 [Acipenser ruthenus]